MFDRTIRVKPDRNSDIIFQAISWYAQDVEFEDDESSEWKYMIKVFGVDQQHRTVSVTVTDFTPFFYIRVPDNWNDNHVSRFVKHLEESNLSKQVLQSLKSTRLVRKKDFWGFTNFKEFNFVRFCFSNLAAMRKLTYFLGNPLTIPALQIYKHKFQQYESNIEPFLRFIHLNNIQPTGWLKIPAGTFRSTDILTTSCQLDVEVRWSNVKPFESEDTARFLIASFDLECMSDTGDFPVAYGKQYKKMASDLYEAYHDVITKKFSESQYHDLVFQCLLKPFELNDNIESFMPALQRMNKVFTVDESYDKTHVFGIMKKIVDDVVIILAGKRDKIVKREQIVDAINKLLSYPSFDLPEVRGDAVIQIGTTFHYYGDRECCEKVIITNGSCSDITGARVISCANEEEVLVKWQHLVQTSNPDVITGYNIFGFDFAYLYDRARALGIVRSFMRLSRFTDIDAKWEVRMLSSSALGDNELKFIDMYGRVLIDMMKVVQRDHKLDSYKLDVVASHFMNMKKNDVLPKDIFRLQKGNEDDRKIIAEYCIQDCALCNHLMMKLEILANNMGMSNVCLVPLSYIFMRGQGIKIFSLVLKQCKDEGFVIPVKKPASKFGAKPVVTEEAEAEDSYEGAIVLEPKTGIYINQPITVFDYASLYPSSMISENLSHDMIILEEHNGVYDNIPGIDYLNISYDLYEGIGDKKKKVGEQTCRFAQLPDNKKGIIPRILQKLLGARKSTRKKIEWQQVTMLNGDVYRGYVKETDDYVGIKIVDGTNIGEEVKVAKQDVQSINDCYNEFQKAVLDGLQLAYKITANSLYGQIGAKTSPIYLKEIAACTTATGRKMIMMAKEYMETNYPGSEVVYGDTDSLFVKFDTCDNCGNTLQGHEALKKCREIGLHAQNAFKKLIKQPHDLELEKFFDPFILLSKKRYVGNMYEVGLEKCKQKSMGIVLKRRDNAHIVKKIYGGAIDIILNQKNVRASVDFVRDELEKLINGETPLDDLIISKSLRADYADPTRIAHKVLAERIGERDPGNRPQINDRIPYVYVEQPPPDPTIPKSKQPKILQGERIESPSYIREHNLRPDYGFYITNQIMKPILQLYGTVADELGLRQIEEYQQQYQELLLAHDNEAKAKDKYDQLRENDVKKFIFDPFLAKIAPDLIPKSRKKDISTSKDEAKPKRAPRKTVLPQASFNVFESISTNTTSTDELSQDLAEKILAPKRKVIRSKKVETSSTETVKRKIIRNTPDTKQLTIHHE